MRFIYKGKDHTKDIPQGLYHVITDDIQKYERGLYDSLLNLTKSNFKYFNQHPQYGFSDDEDFIVAMVMHVTLDILRDK